MRVLIAPAHRLLTTTYGSEFVWPVNLAHELVERGHEVVLVAGGADPSIRRDLTVSVVFRKPAVRRGTPLKQASRVATFPWKCAWATSRLAHRADVIHHFLPFGRNTFNPYFLSPIARAKATLIGPLMQPTENAEDQEFAQWLGTERGMITSAVQLMSRVVAPLASSASKATLRAATLLVAINDAAGAAYSQVAGRADIEIIPAAVDTRRFLNTGAPPADATIAFVGNLVPRKGVDILLRAFSAVRQIYPAAQLVIAGDGPSFGLLRSLAGELRLGSSTHFLGHVSEQDLLSVYRRASVVVNPTRFEAFGMVNLEAMAAGRPVISTNLPGMANMVPSSCGVLVGVDMTRDFAQAIMAVLADPVRAAAMGAAGRRYVEKEYSLPAVARRWEEVYARALMVHQSR